MYTVTVNVNTWLTAQIWLTHNYMTCPRDYTIQHAPGSVIITFECRDNAEWFSSRWADNIRR